MEQPRETPIHQRRMVVWEAALVRLAADPVYRLRLLALATALESLRIHINQAEPAYARLVGTAGVRDLLLTMADVSLPGAEPELVEQELRRQYARSARISPDNPIQLLPNGDFRVPPDVLPNEKHFMEIREYLRSTRPEGKRGRPRKNMIQGF